MLLAKGTTPSIPRISTFFIESLKLRDLPGLAGMARVADLLAQPTPQLLRNGSAPQFTNRLALDLTDPFSREIK